MLNPNNPHETDYQRIFIALLLGSVLLIGWQALVEWPRRQALARYNTEHMAQRAKEDEKQALTLPHNEPVNPGLTHEQLMAASPRMMIHSDMLHGSIALKGARFDDLRLALYHETLDPTSPEVTLFSPGGDDSQPYFAVTGWLSPDGKTKVPDANTLWQADKKTLEPGTTTLSWDNGQGVTFILTIALDDAYMFTIHQRVENKSGHDISLSTYGYINRAYDIPQKTNLTHEGPLGVLEGSLQESTYKELRDKGSKTFDDASGWFGITDQYWVSALIPAEPGFKATFSHYMASGKDRYQTDYLGAAQTIASGATNENSVRLFGGAKELKLLDRYAQGDSAHPPIVLFDRAIDFGWFYFISKPLFLLLIFFHGLVGNFGIAILLLTVTVKLCMFPLANKSFRSAAHMRRLQPEMMKIRERYADDHIRMQQETLALYKREKVNPAAGCLPVFIQLPVFFALYKVLYVAIEMRHTPFFGWIKDLSVADPSNIFTLFGLVDWPAPAFLHIGVLPILMCATMVIQMRQQPKPPDPVQAKMMSYMPYIMLYMFSRFAAGLVIYWVCSNTLSILQQQVITRRHQRVQQEKAAA